MWKLDIIAGAVPTSGFFKFVNFRRTPSYFLDENKDLWNLLKTFLYALAVLQAKQYSLFKENNMEKQFNSMTGYMKRTSKAPESCGGWAHILWNAVRRQVSTDLKFPM